MKVFIGGSRRITRLHPEVRRRIDQMIESRASILVGDANGADRAVQEHLHANRYGSVEVFVAAGRCRNNAGGWPVRNVDAPGRKWGFEMYAAKDRVMADEASSGLMLWDGHSLGTMMNVLRLTRQQKPALVFLARTSGIVELRSSDDAEVMVTRHAPELMARIEEVSISERADSQGPRQASLF